MGFDNVYLAGCDYTRNPSRNLHWYEKGKGEIEKRIDYEKGFFDIAKEFINITTITLEGKSDTINSITYEEYTSYSPLFEENDKLLDKKYLNVLNSAPKYKVF